MAWEICNMKWGFAKKAIIKSQRQFMYGSNFYESDVIYVGFQIHLEKIPNPKLGQAKVGVWFESGSKFDLPHSRYLAS